MTEIAMTTKQRKPNKFAMAISFLMALPLAAVLLIHPGAMLDANGHYNHSALMMLMIGIAAGFIHGVGFLPRFWLWKWLFSPYVACPLMLWGYYTWFLT